MERHERSVAPSVSRVLTFTDDADEYGEEGEAEEETVPLLSTSSSSTSSSSGVRLSFSDLTVVRVTPPECLCEAGTAALAGGGVHVVLDTDGEGGGALLGWLATGRPRCRYEGRVCVNGRPLRTPSDWVAWRRAVCVVGSSGLLPDCALSVGDFLALLFPRRAAQAAEALQFVGVPARLRLGAALAAFDCWRVRVAAALASGAPVLLFPYPFDMELPTAVQAHAMMGVLKGAARRFGRTVLLCSHHMAATRMDLVGDLADTLLLLGARGRVLYAGAAASAVGYFDALHIPRSPSGAARLSASRLELHSRGTTPARAAGGGEEVAVGGAYDVEALAVEWAQSDEQTSFYAAKYYDSALRRALAAQVAYGDANCLLASAPSLPGVVDNGGEDGGWRLQLRLMRAAARDDSLALLAAQDGVVLVLLAALLVAAQGQPQSQEGLFNAQGWTFLVVVAVVADAAVRQGRQPFIRELRALTRHTGPTFAAAVLYAAAALAVAAGRYALLFGALQLLVGAAALTTAAAALVGLVGLAHALAVEVVLVTLPARRPPSPPRMPTPSATQAVAALAGYSVALCGFVLPTAALPRWVGLASLGHYAYGCLLRERLAGRSYGCPSPPSSPSSCLCGDDVLAARGLLDGPEVPAAMGVLAAVVAGCTCCLVAAVRGTRAS